MNVTITCKVKFFGILQISTQTATASYNVTRWPPAYYCNQWIKLNPCQREKQVASLPVSDVYHYVVIKKLLDSVFNILPVFIYRWESKIYRVRIFLTRWQWVRVDDVKQKCNSCECPQVLAVLLASHFFLICPTSLLPFAGSFLGTNRTCTNSRYEYS
jgi:hypothetical protein